MDQKTDLTKAKSITALSAAEIMEMEISPQSHIVDGIITGGLNLLAGKPKMGKSWFALNIAVAVSKGELALGKLPVEKKSVLYLALEDNDRRIQERLASCLDGSEAPQNLYFVNQIERTNEGGIESLNKWLDEHPDVKLVIIDVFTRFRTAPRTSNAYSEEYKAITSLKAIADTRSISILVIHHLNKLNDTDDPHDMISGTTAMTGAPDTILILKRERGLSSDEAILFVEGRDVERQEIEMKFDEQITSWVIVGKYEGHQKTQERQEIIDLLRKSAEPMSPKQISEALNKAGGAIRGLLRKLYAGGDLITTKHGFYTTPHKINNNDNINNANDNDNNGNNRLLLGMDGR